MSPDERTEIRNASGLGLLLVIAAVVVCACGGCKSDARPPLSEVQGLEILELLRDVQKTLKQPHEPTPAPIDYGQRFDAIDAKLTKLAEHSVVVTPPAPKPPCKPKGHK